MDLQFLYLATDIACGSYKKKLCNGEAYPVWSVDTVLLVAWRLLSGTPQVTAVFAKDKLPDRSIQPSHHHNDVSRKHL
jgi:hypothetical protein